MSLILPNDRHTMAKKNKANQPIALVCHSKDSPAAGSGRADRVCDCDEQDWTVIGIGASAGGLEAITDLLSNLPVLRNAAVVIIQHRGKDGSSLMPSLLKKSTRMTVAEIREGMQIEPGVVYLNPAHMEVVLDRRTFHIREYTLSDAPLPIDTFFNSLAEQLRNKAICIILSGTGSDGSHGLVAVQEAGGLTIVQDEEQAKYKGMPQSAVATRHVDKILRVEDMGPQIVRYIKHPFQVPHEEQTDSSADWLERICSIIKDRTGQDLAGYKASTLKRRIQKRMALHQIQETSGYIRYLEENKKEAALLLDEALITVTNFFRDQQAWKSLRETVIKSLIQRKSAQDSVRVWVAGCASGEEAYSTGILLSEEMLLQDKSLTVQIFASDISERSIKAARKGIYPKSIETDMPDAKWLDRYFDRLDSGYRIKKNIREMAIFAIHNIIQDPPFSRIDLVCCRNALIYMKSKAQKQALSSFHYCLNPQGYLFLGTSETTGEFTDVFSVLDSKNKIFQSKQSDDSYDHKRRSRPLYIAASSFAHKEEHGTPEQQPNARDIYEAAERLILRHYTNPCVLVDENFDIVYLCGDTARYLRHPAGKPNLNLLQMLQPQLHHTVDMVLRQAAKEQKPVVHKGLSVKDQEEFGAFDLLVHPVRVPDRPSLFLLAVFQPARSAQTAVAPTATSARGRKTPREAQLQRELEDIRHYLSTTMQEMEARNEKLQASNEELQSINEELKSTNEELETSREELQSTNEELRSVNEERTRQNEELSRTRDDLQNFLSSTHVATVFLDTELNIKRYTFEAAAQFNFRESDIGRPLRDITHHLEYPALLDDALSVLNRLATVEKEIGAKNWQTFTVRMMPYRTTQNVIEGVVITLIDVTREKAVREYAESIVETVREPLLVLDEQIKVISVNKAFHTRFKTNSEQIKNVRLYDLGNGQWNIPELKTLLEHILPDNQWFEDFVVEHEFPEIGFRKMLLNARQITNKSERTKRILLAIEDITDHPKEGQNG